jgi:hypothetical protein
MLFSRRNRLRQTCLLLVVCVSPLPGSGAGGPAIARVFPLGGRQGTSVSLQILGDGLSNATAVQFDCEDLKWLKTTHASSGKLEGMIAIAPRAPLGPHILRVATLDGYSTSAIFNVGQFPSVLEIEPNDRPAAAQEIRSLPAEIQGRLDGAADIDVYAMHVRAGERWTFDLRSIEYGSSLEARMFLLDAAGNRLAFNDDRNDFDETPFLDHTFQKDGTYRLVLDQYRGPRGFNFGKNCTYILRISALPNIAWISPLGAKIGATARIRLSGTALQTLRNVYLTEMRRAEYARLTYPYTMPVQFKADPATADQVPRIAGRIVKSVPDLVEAEFTIPAATHPGLWRLWAAGPGGVADGTVIELSAAGEQVMDGALDRPGKVNVHRIDARAGVPLHVWTLAAQIGVPRLDSVLEIRDESGRKLAENDDVVAGQGTLIGNPDSSVFYTPQKDGPLFAAVKDRTGRGGPGFQYRLKIADGRPGFHLVTTPENFNIPRGGSAEIKVHLIREAGFSGEVAVWFEGMPAGIEAPRGKFRADQLFEPNADGADMLIPEIAFRMSCPASFAAGAYPIRVLGESEDHRTVEAHTTLIMGPLLDLWNFIRRPAPRIEMTVYEPFEARLSASPDEISLKRGESATLQVKAENVPDNAAFQVMELPEGVSYRLMERSQGQVTVQLEAAADAPLGTGEISAEALIGSRRAASPLVKLSVVSAPATPR